MNIKEINELLATPEVKEVVDAAINEALEAKQKELDAKILALDEDKRQLHKEVYLHKKTLVAKAQLFEQKVNALAEKRITEATKKLSDDVFAFIERSTNNTVKAIAEEVNATSKAARLQEAFTQAMRILAPHMNLDSVTESVTAQVEKLKTSLNQKEREILDLRNRILSDDVTELVVKECNGYSLEDQTEVISALKAAKPKSLVEAKNLISTVKEKLRSEVKDETVVESVITTTHPEPSKAQIKAIAEQAIASAPVVKPSEVLDPTEMF